MDTIALYMRLSSEDANEGESNSIGNQRDLLKSFIESHREFDGCNIMEFVDDGYTGTNFDRPGVQEMFSLAGNLIRCIIVKDFSRFGRNMIAVGDYLDQIFPFLGVRFIAVNEDYDSKKCNGSSVSLDVSLKTLVYELYSRDISKKIRSVQQAKMGKGEYLCGIAFYGYKKSSVKKNQLEIDEPAAEVVRRIFQMAAEKIKPMQIARTLNAEGIPSPLAYRRENHTDGGRGWKVAGSKVYWTSDSVHRILVDERYTGCLVSRKRQIIDISTKKTQPVPRNEWIIAPAAHEAIISSEMFQKVQQICGHQKSKITVPKRLFSGILKCAVCNRTLNCYNIKSPYYFCPTGKVLDGSPCQKIHLDEADLRNTVLVLIKAQIQLVVRRSHPVTQTGSLEKELRDCEEAVRMYNVLQTNAFEDYAEGRISRQKYLDCKQEAAERRAECYERLEKLNKQRAGQKVKPASSGSLESCLSAAELTREMLTAFVKQIRVSGTDTLEVIWNFDDILPSI